MTKEVEIENGETGLCIALIAVAAASLFAYTFRPTLDMNGDTAQYYIYATPQTMPHCFGVWSPHGSTMWS